MKGLIFTALNDYIEESFGLAYWDYLIKQSTPQSEGVYTASKSYPDQEIANYIEIICNEKHIKPEVLLEGFGEFLFPELYEFHKTIMNEFDSFNDFIFSVNDIIHVEVNKLWQETKLPTIKTQQKEDQTILMEYSSQRKLCYLAIGLIKGASKQYSQPISLNHIQCMHSGAQSCLIEIYTSENE
ncbi:heme NO-binding domain-containing protein [Thiotrichales bacterium 19S3-7]|nr:heme NO-binding domain-containing protein [Thiotrichales bacterium 19S3-7]MCF6802425.1 heme NO-binding domain-containing protein [Thiotrichales bacterium 19S3-11]